MKAPIIIMGAMLLALGAGWVYAIFFKKAGPEGHWFTAESTVRCEELREAVRIHAAGGWELHKIQRVLGEEYPLTLGHPYDAYRCQFRKPVAHDHPTRKPEK